MWLIITICITVYLSIIGFYLYKFWQHEKEMQRFADVMQEGLEIYADKVEKLRQENPEQYANRQAAARECR